MNVEQLITILNECRHQELPVMVTGNNSFGADITNVDVVEDAKILLLYENSYYTKTEKHLLSPVKTIKDLLSILSTVEDKGMQIKGRGTNGVIVSPSDFRICYVDDYAMLNLYDKLSDVTMRKAKKDARTFIDGLYID